MNHPLKFSFKKSSSSSDTEILFAFQSGQKNWSTATEHHSALIDKVQKKDAFSAGFKALCFVPFSGKDKNHDLLFVGCGDGKDFNEEKARTLGGLAWSKLSAEKSKKVSIPIETLFPTTGTSAKTVCSWIRAFAEGIALRAYSFEKYKTKADSTKKAAVLEIEFSHKDGEGDFAGLEDDFEQVLAIQKAVTVTRDWSNEPSNMGTPEYYAQEAQKLARAYGLKCKILTEKDAEKEGMNLFLGVGQGSDREGRIVVLEYTPKANKKAKTLALVGKGITFDSGGISIKPSLRMEEMKHDMTGAATIMGAVLLAAAWKVPNKIVGILGFTENMPNGNAIQPGNVITSRNGKTVEIINTDAEGRLILADLLDYAHSFKPDAIINAATLTGAVGIALGKQCCALLGNDQALMDRILETSQTCSERMWQLPLYDEYFEDLKSEYADMRNSANDGHGGTIRGAIFMKQFIKKNMPWAHLDIAATAWDVGHLAYLPKRGASGLYVRTLAQLCNDF